MIDLVIGTLNDPMLVKLATTLSTERVTTWKGSRLLLVVIIRLETNAALKD